MYATGNAVYRTRLTQMSSFSNFDIHVIVLDWGAYMCVCVCVCVSNTSVIAY